MQYHQLYSESITKSKENPSFKDIKGWKKSEL